LPVVGKGHPIRSGHDIEANGATLPYEEHGDGGMPLVLVHGGLVSSAMWEPLIPLLTASGDLGVITPDTAATAARRTPKGHSRTPGSPTTWRR
jgi:pimeloyl-ACP methyl ester carboxylesterase